jgi:hypothetical protein
MTTLSDAWQAGIDAVVVDNTLSKGDFADAMRTVITSNFSNGEATSLIDAVATEFNRVGVINNPTYGNLRSNIINDAVAHKALFDSLSTIGQLGEAKPAEAALELIELRAERDEINTSITTMQGFKTGATRQVKDALNQGIENLRGHKEQIRQRIQQITGDPDS